MFAPGGRSLGFTVIFVLTASSTACISSHCFVVVPVSAGDVDLGAVERAEGVDVLTLPELAPLTELAVLPVPYESVVAPFSDGTGVNPVPDAAVVDPVSNTTVVVPVPDEELV